MKSILSLPGTRIKCLSVHPTRPLLLAGYHTGEVRVFSFSGNILRDNRESSATVRACCWDAAHGQYIAGDDRGKLRFYNIDDGSCCCEIKAHTDFVRVIIHHPSQPYIYTAGDDCTVRLWELTGETPICRRVFIGHENMVMSLAITSDEQFVISGSQDSTVRMWPAFPDAAAKLINAEKISQPAPTNGVIEPLRTMRVPAPVSAVTVTPMTDQVLVGCDDCGIYVIDLNGKASMRTLTGHRGCLTSFCSDVSPFILSGAEDATVRVWDAWTYEPVTDFFAGEGNRIWCIASLSARRRVALGTDNGLIIVKLTESEPSVCYDTRTSKFFAAVRATGAATGIGIGDHLVSASAGSFGDVIVHGSDDPLPLEPLRPFGSSLQMTRISRIIVSGNGRLVAVAGSGQYAVLSSINGRMQRFGECVDAEIAWASQGSRLGVLTSRGGTSTVDVYASFADDTEPVALRFDDHIDFIRGGGLLCLLCAVSGSCYFVDWETGALLSHVTVERPRDVVWSQDNTRFALIAEDAIYVLNYSPQSGTENPESTISLVTTIRDNSSGAAWLSSGDVPNDILALVHENGHVDAYFLGVSSEPMGSHSVGRLPEDSILLGSCVKPPASTLISVRPDGMFTATYVNVDMLAFWAAISRHDAARAVELAQKLPGEELDAASRALISLGKAKDVIQMLPPSRARIDAALAAGDMPEALSVAKSLTPSSGEQSPTVKAIWSAIIDGALMCGDLSAAYEASTYAGPDSSLLIASCLGTGDQLRQTARVAAEMGELNTAFTAAFASGDTQTAYESLIASDPSSAAIFARAYCPEHMDTAVKAWKSELTAMGEPTGVVASIAEPSVQPELFPELSA